MPVQNIRVRTEKYKMSGMHALRLLIAEPPAYAIVQRPVFAYVHCGGWNDGAPHDALHIIKYFARRGMTGVAIEYRRSDRCTTTPIDAMDDVCDAIIWLKAHAPRLNVDPKAIVVAGSSAGGHLALSAAFFDKKSERGDSTPRAVIAWCPAVDVVCDNWFCQLLLSRAAPSAVSPSHNVRSGLPPVLIMQGDADGWTPITRTLAFIEKMRAARNETRLRILEGRGHSFEKTPRDMVLTAGYADEFLRELGVLTSEPTFEAIGALGVEAEQFRWRLTSRVKRRLRWFRRRVEKFLRLRIIELQIVDALGLPDDLIR